MNKTRTYVTVYFSYSAVRRCRGTTGTDTTCSRTKRTPVTSAQPPRNLALTVTQPSQARPTKINHTASKRDDSDIVFILV